MLGAGLLKGLAVTGRNFVGSYFRAERMVTVEYPEVRKPLKENSRQFPFLVYDGEDPEAGLRCVACQICEKECPPQCIYIEKSKTKKPDYVGKPQFFPAVFNIDVSVCMSCQICVEVCPFEAIKMDQEFELCRTDRFEGLLFRKERLARSNDYFRKLHPTEAGEIDARRAAEQAKAEAKARADAQAKAEAKVTAEKPAGANPAPSAGSKPAGKPAVSSAAPSKTNPPGPEPSASD